MFKKVLVSLIIAVLFSILMSNMVFAQDGLPTQPFLRGEKVIGKIATMGEDRFTLKKVDNSEQVVLVDENTRYRNKERQELGFEDLKTGMWVLAVEPRGDEEFLAKLVVILPEDFDPSRIPGHRILDKVKSVNTASGIITLFNRQQGEITVEVDEHTRYLGAIQSLDDIQEGMLAMILAKEEADGTLLAKVVGARFPIIKHAGVILSVNAAGNSFTLKTRLGEELTFSVSEKTRFRSREDAVKELEDLKPQMVAIVIAKPGEEGILEVAVVAVGEKEDLPQFDLKVLGKITEIGEDSFTLENRQGEKHTFEIDDETIFRSRGSHIQGLDDLKEGMPVMVGAEELEGGTYLAKIVIVGRVRKPLLSMPGL